MAEILIDGIKTVTFHNGVLRIDCVAVGPNAEERPSGTLLIPANVAGAVVQALANSLQELQKQMTERAGQTVPTGQGAPN
jgi:hypothetical protein